MSESNSSDVEPARFTRWYSIAKATAVGAVFIVVFICACVYVQAHMSGWTEVARRYPYSGTENSSWPLDGRADISTPGLLLEVADAGGAKIDDLGIYLDSSISVFNPFPPIFIPWEGVRSVRRCNIFPETHVIVYLHVDNPKTDIEFRGGLARECQATAELQGISVSGPDPDALPGLH